MTEAQLRAEADALGMVLTSRAFWEAAANAIRFQSELLSRIKYEELRRAAREAP